MRRQTTSPAPHRTGIRRSPAQSRGDGTARKNDAEQKTALSGKATSHDSMREDECRRKATSPQAPGKRAGKNKTLQRRIAIRRCNVLDGGCPTSFFNPPKIAHSEKFPNSDTNEKGVSETRQTAPSLRYRKRRNRSPARHTGLRTLSPEPTYNTSFCTLRNNSTSSAGDCIT